MLALAQPAEARIIYTAAHVVIDENYAVYHLDLNHDGATDFVLSLSASCDNFCGSRLLATGQAGNGAEGENEYAAALHRGAHIGPKRHFAPFNALVTHTFTPSGVWYRSRGPWRNVTNRYIGLKFVIKGRIHYGWARMDVRRKAQHLTGTLTGYAYQTVPIKPIIAGETKGSDVIAVQPASLGHLAAGVASIPARR